MLLPIWKIIKILWPLWIILAIYFMLQIILAAISGLVERWKSKKEISSQTKWRSDRDLLRWLRGMTPEEFEKYIAELFSKLGYEAMAVGASHDEGIDVIAKKNGVSHYIQCKKYITSEVPVGAVRDFYGAIVDRLANSKGYFITTNKFTLEAEKFAEDKPIELIDGFELVRYIYLAEQNNPKKF